VILDDRAKGVHRFQQAHVCARERGIRAYDRVTLRHAAPLMTFP
jgi:hypothetical protein